MRYRVPSTECRVPNKSSIREKFYLDRCLSKGDISRFLTVIFLAFALVGFVSAGAIQDDLHLNLQVVDGSGKVLVGTYDFEFNITTDSGCSNVIYSDSATLTTDARGIISHYLNSTSLGYQEEYFLCYYRDSTLIETVRIARTPYAFTAKNVNMSGIVIDSNLDMSGFNLTADYLSGDGSGLSNLNISSIDMSEYYNTTEVDSKDALVNSSIVSWVNSLFVKIADLVGLVGNWSADKPNYYNKTEVYNTTEVDSLISTGTANSTNYWDSLDTPADILGSQINNDLSWVELANLVGLVGNWSQDQVNYYLISQVYNKTETYNQTEVDALVSSGSVNTTNYWDSLDTPADILGSQINDDLDWVEMSEIVSLVGNWSDEKVNYYLASQVYNKSEVDSLISTGTANSTNYWDGLDTPADISGSEINNDLNWVNDSGVVQAVGNWSAEKNNYYLKTETYNQTEIDSGFVPYLGASGNLNMGVNNVSANYFVGDVDSSGTSQFGNVFASDVNVSGVISSGTDICIDGGDCLSSVTAGSVAGTGTQNYVPVWTGASSIGSSTIVDNGTHIGLGRGPVGSAGVTVEAGGSYPYSIYIDDNKSISWSDGSYVGPSGGLFSTYSGSDISFSGNNGTATNTLMFMDVSSQNVGVGTASPNARLEVSGGNFQIGNSAMTSGNPTQYIYGYDNSATSAKYGRLSIGSDGTFAIVAEDTYLLLDAASYVQVQATANFMESILMRNNKAISMSNTEGSFKHILTVDSSNLVKMGSVGSSWATGSEVGIFTNGTEKVRIAEDGNVGIGTTTPQNSLNVVGDLNVTGTIHGINASSVNYWTQSGSDLYYDSGDVGIGTNNPVAALDIRSGDVYIFGNSNRRFLMGDSASLGQYGGFRWQTADDSISFGHSGSSGNMRNVVVESDGDILLNSENSGDVGIGTDAPGARLEINGTDNKIRLRYDSVDYSEVSTSNLGILKLSPGVGGTTGYVDIEQTHTLYGFLMHRGAFWGGQGVDASGNFGISTSDSAKDIVFYGNNFQAADEIMRLEGAGNVGINTTTPSTTLDVEGTVSMTELNIESSRVFIDGEGDMVFRV